MEGTMVQFDRTSTLQDVVRMIAAGMLDKELETVAAAVNTRRKFIQDTVGMVNLMTMTPGTRVVLTKVSPKYLSGMSATVIAVDGDKVKIEIDRGYNTRRYGHIVTVFPTSIQRLVEG